MGDIPEAHFSVPHSLGQNPFLESDARHSDWQQFESDTLKGLVRFITKLNDLSNVTDAASYSAWRSKYLEWKLPENYDQQTAAWMNQDQAHWIIRYFTEAADRAVRIFVNDSGDIDQIIERLAASLRATIGTRVDDAIMPSRITHWREWWLERARLEVARQSVEEFVPLSPRDKWFLPDADFASHNSAFFEPVKSHRLNAIATLRREMEDIVEKTRPRTTDDLYRVLLPAVVSYAEDLFDASADAKLQSSGKPRSYEKWLDRCEKAVISDCCEGMGSQFPAAVGLLAEFINERQTPETFRAAIGLWGAWNPFSSDPFSEQLKNYLCVHLATQTRLRWRAKAHAGAMLNGNHPQKRTDERSPHATAVQNRQEEPSTTQQSAKGRPSLSERDAQVHDLVGEKNFSNLTNAEIMRDRLLKKQLREKCNLNTNDDATKCCLDRVRNAKGYPLSREVTKKRSSRQ